MAIGLIRQRWMLALLALVVAVFVINPVAEAATCGFEAAHVHAIAKGDVDPDDHADVAGHDDCAHGHCHHGGYTPLLSADVSSIAVFISGGQRIAMPDEALTPFAPDGLKRPPQSLTRTFGRRRAPGRLRVTLWNRFS